MDMQPLRSVLYVPGDNERALDKAVTLAADAFVFDLEDAVADPAKTAACERVCALLAGTDFGRRLRVVRINDADARQGEEDLIAVLAAAPDAVLLPKLQSADDLARHLARIDELGDAAKIGHLKVWAMIETPAALLDIRALGELAASHPPRLAAFVLGSNDLVAATGLRAGPRRENLVPWMMSCVLVAKAFGLAVIDAVCNDFDDVEGLAAECRQARDMGFDGKTLIHPNQIAICNEVFAPSAEELSEAARLAAAFARPDNEGRNVIALDGRMFERLHLEVALRTLALAEAIAKG